MIECPKCRHHFQLQRKPKVDKFPPHLVGMGEVHAGQRCCQCERKILAGDECWARDNFPDVLCSECRVNRGAFSSAGRRIFWFEPKEYQAPGPKEDRIAFVHSVAV